MTEAELLKQLLTYAPSVAIIIGIAKIYLKVSMFIQSVELQLTRNSHDIATLRKIHIARHDEDAKEFLNG